MATIISAGTTTGTGFGVSPDTSGSLAIQTGATPATALTLNADQTTLFATSMREKVTVSATAMTGTINFDAISQSILYYTSNASANATINFRGNSSTSLNTMMAVGDSLSVVFIATQNTTAYYLNAFQIDGTSVTPKWQGGSAPTAGNASSLDVYAFTIIKTASATYTVLASQTQFKA